jgi:type VI secretion system protein VasI
LKVLKIGCASLFLLWAFGYFIYEVTVKPKVEEERNEQARQLAARLASPTRKWRIERSRSSFDDSMTVDLSLNAETAVSGWLGKVRTPVLGLRCYEHKTYAYIETGMTANVEYGLFHQATIRIRLDHEPAKTTVTDESTDSQALFFEQPIALIRSLLGHQQLTLGFTPFNSPPVETTFDLRGVEAAIVPLREACGWK